MSEGRNEKIIALFDVDGTLTPARKEISSEMKAFIAELRKKIVIGTVGGSDLPKQKEQLGSFNIGLLFLSMMASNSPSILLISVNLISVAAN